MWTHTVAKVHEQLCVWGGVVCVCVGGVCVCVCVCVCVRGVGVCVGRGVIQLDLETNSYLKTKNVIAFFSVIVATVAMRYTRFRLEQALITLTAHIHPPTHTSAHLPVDSRGVLPVLQSGRGSHRTHPVYLSLPTVRSSSSPS